MENNITLVYKTKEREINPKLAQIRKQTPNDQTFFPGSPFDKNFAFKCFITGSDPTLKVTGIGLSASCAQRSAKSASP